MLFRDQYLVIK